MPVLGWKTEQEPGSESAASSFSAEEASPAARRSQTSSSYSVTVTPPVVGASPEIPVDGDFALVAGRTWKSLRQVDDARRAQKKRDEQDPISCLSGAISSFMTSVITCRTADGGLPTCCRPVNPFLEQGNENSRYQRPDERPVVPFVMYKTADTRTRKSQDLLYFVHDLSRHFQSALQDAKHSPEGSSILAQVDETDPELLGIEAPEAYRVKSELKQISERVQNRLRLQHRMLSLLDHLFLQAVEALASLQEELPPQTANAAALGLLVAGVDVDEQGGYASAVVEQSKAEQPVACSSFSSQSSVLKPSEETVVAGEDLYWISHNDLKLENLLVSEPTCPEAIHQFLSGDMSGICSRSMQTSLVDSSDAAGDEGLAAQTDGNVGVSQLLSRKRRGMEEGQLQQDQVVQGSIEAPLMLPPAALVPVSSSKAVHQPVLDAKPSSNTEQSEDSSAGSPGAAWSEAREEASPMNGPPRQTVRDAGSRTHQHPVHDNDEGNKSRKARKKDFPPVPQFPTAKRTGYEDASSSSACTPSTCGSIGRGSPTCVTGRPSLSTLLPSAASLATRSEPQSPVVVRRRRSLGEDSKDNTAGRERSRGGASVALDCGKDAQQRQSEVDEQKEQYAPALSQGQLLTRALSTWQLKMIDFGFSRLHHAHIPSTGTNTGATATATLKGKLSPALSSLPSSSSSEHHPLYHLPGGGVGEEMTLVGTPMYVAPEGNEKRNSDTWALAVAVIRAYSSLCHSQMYSNIFNDEAKVATALHQRASGRGNRSGAVFARIAEKAQAQALAERRAAVLHEAARNLSVRRAKLLVGIMKSRRELMRWEDARRDLLATCTRGTMGLREYHQKKPLLDEKIEKVEKELQKAEQRHRSLRMAMSQSQRSWHTNVRETFEPLGLEASLDVAAFSLGLGEREKGMNAEVLTDLREMFFFEAVEVDDKFIQELFQAVASSRVAEETPGLCLSRDPIPERAKLRLEVMRGMLTVNPGDRMTAAQAAERMQKVAQLAETDEKGWNMNLDPLFEVSTGLME
ncbi:unnamed protein product [Amoebophrya sp. A25]|nr:unnamed protein product [Amoebophrya sp. A25]|eukprot:GSA25T00022810001.1